jgi:Xaa-Pro aminopeptidase
MKSGARVQFSPQKVEALIARRQRILAALNGGLLLAASRPAFHKYDASYFRYRQDPNFYYLSGLYTEDQGVVLLVSGEKPQSILFVEDRDAATEIWNGPMIGLDGAAQLGFDQVLPLGELPRVLPELMQKATMLYTDRQHHPGVERILHDIVFRQRIAFDGLEVRDFWGFLGDFRLIKDAFEIELMQTANRISAAAHKRCMKEAHAGMSELELQALLELEMKKGGSPFTAYHSIVASGSNTCCLHYNVNCCPLESGDLVLIDAGCAFEGYASDITRTWPVDGRFTADQRLIYELVLRTQKSIIEMVRPGVKIPDLQEAAIKLLTEGLIEHGVIKMSYDAARANDTFKAWYPHGVSHYLGLNVHDAGRYVVEGQRRPLEPGMVITVEPGIYIQPDSPHTDSRWHGIGVRIEDDILVTAQGYRNLTDCPKEVAELEALRS